MTLTQPETDALIRAWREQSAQPLSPATSARLTAIVRALQDHDPKAMRKWLIHGGDLGAHFGTTARAIEAKAKANTAQQARILATDFAGADALDHTVAEPFYIDELLDDAPRVAAEPAPAAPMRPVSRSASPRQAARSTPLTAEREHSTAPWQADNATPDPDRIQYPEWRKVGAVAFACATLAAQTLLLVALISAVYAWQTGTALDSQWFLPLGVVCAAVVLGWVCQRTFTRFQRINDRSSRPLTAPRIVKLAFVPLFVAAGLAVASELGRPLLEGTAFTGAHLSIALLTIGLLFNTAYCHTVPRLRTRRD